MPMSCLWSCRFPTTENLLPAGLLSSILAERWHRSPQTHALRRDRIRDELFRGLIGSWHANSIVHQSARLQFPDQLKEAIAVVFLLVMQTVEPDPSNRAVFRQQLGQL